MIVLKIGGNALAKTSDLEWIDVLTEHLRTGQKFVLVHGGGPQIDDELKLHGIERRFIEGFRFTDQATMDVVEMVLAGHVQQRLVRLLRSRGIAAVGVTGSDGGSIIAKKRFSPNGDDLGLVGIPVKVDPNLITSLLESGFLPLVSPVSSDEEGQGLNINADLVAGALAGTLEAERIVFMTDVDGIYSDFPNPASLIREIPLGSLTAMRAEFTGGMVPKVEAVIEALVAGARQANVIDGRSGAALRSLLAGDRVGTLVTNGPVTHG